MAIKLYVNGDSHSAGAEAVNPHAFAQDDGRYWSLGRQPHPDNLAVSWGQQLADKLGASLYCDAESASSNSRIKRTTIDHLTRSRTIDNWPDFVIIGWSTWERQEWLYDDVYWQVNAGGIGQDWPTEIKHRYRNYVINIDYNKCLREAHKSIYELHLDLTLLNIKHLFFNTFEPLSVTDSVTDWRGCYLEPYDRKFTYYNWCLAQGFQTVAPGSYHFGPDAHAAWAEFIYPYIVQTALTQ